MRTAVLGILIATHFGIGCDCGGSGLSFPAVTIDTPAEGASFGIASASSLTLSGTCTDIGEPVVISGDGTASVRCVDHQWTAQVDASGAPDGVVTFHADHSNGPGRAATQATRTLVKDTVAPTLTITRPAAGTVITSLKQANFVVEGTCSENGQPVVISGAVTATTVCANNAWTVSLNFSQVADGAVTVKVDHADLAGNAAVQIVRQFTKTANGPDVSIVSPLDGSFINAATVAAFPANGLCTENGRPVVITGSTSQSTTCTAGAWSTLLNFSALPDGPANLLVNHSDAIGNAAPEAMVALVKDTVAPILASVTITNASPISSPVLSLSYGAQSGTFAAICILENNSQVSGCSAAWVTASTLPPSFTVTATAGLKTLTVWLRDAAGNVSLPITSNTVTLDTGAPTVTLTSLNGGQVLLAGTAQTISWTCTDTDLSATPISIAYSTDGGTTWVTIVTGIANSGSYSWTSPAGLDSANVRVRVVAVDTAGNPGTAVSAAPFTVDASAPVFTAAAMRLNRGISPINTNFVPVEFTVTDTGAPVTDYCLKYNSTTAPTPTDPCWVGVAPAAVLMADVNFRIGFVLGPYDVMAWARNQVGLSSSLGNGGNGLLGQDRASVQYTPVAPPALTGVTASASDATVNLTIPSGGSVFIKWTASGATALSSTPISIYSTTDDTNYTLIAANVANAAGAGCSIAGAQTGCYRWTNGSPTSGYFRIRVGAVDTLSRRTYRSSQPLNVSTILKVLAGSTDPGTEGDAAAAVFITNYMVGSYVDPGALIVSKSGVVYFYDNFRGLLRVDPADGVQHLLIPRTGVSGPMTLRTVYSITFDPQGRILLYDYDRIRRYDTIANTLTTLIGSGANTGATVSPATALQLVPVTAEWEPTLFATADGKIYFQAGGYHNALPGTGINDFNLRVFDPNALGGAGQVTTLNFSGTGDDLNATQNIANCHGTSISAVFDPITGAIQTFMVGFIHDVPGTCSSTPMSMYSTSLISPTTLQPIASQPAGLTHGNNLYTRYFMGANGLIYRIHRPVRHIERYNPTTRSFTELVGGGVSGSCPDGTAATTCSLDVLDAYVSGTNQLYYVERGRIRTVDQAGNIQTLMGSGLAAGDGDLATSARIGFINDVKLWNDGSGDRIIFTDNSECRIREFSIDANISTIAGNGSNGVPAVGSQAAGQPFNFAPFGSIEDMFLAVHPTQGTLFGGFRSNLYISKLDRTTGQWSDLVGGGTFHYYSPTADGKVGSQIDLTGYSAKVIGFDGVNKLLAHKAAFYSNDNQDSFYKIYDTTTGTQTNLAGVTGPGSYQYSPNGTPAASTVISLFPYGASWDPTGARWAFADYDKIRVQAVGGAIGTLGVGLANGPIGAFVYRHPSAGINVAYYCDASHVLRKFDFNTSTASILPWPIARMQCVGKGMQYSTARSSLIFAFQVDGVGGVAEYLNP